MAKAGTVAVLLPGAFYFIRETKVPPVEAFRRHGTAMALATDCNPGSSPLTSPLLTMNMGATLFRMTVAECLARLHPQRGEGPRPRRHRNVLEPGRRADLCLWSVERLAELVYRIGFNPLFARYRGA
jgi:imidazolonepropionase